MRGRLSRYAIVSLVSVLMAGVGTLPAGGAESANLGSFTGVAGSHALKISIGDTVLTIGGGESRASYERAGGTDVEIRGSKAQATARGLVIPGLADTAVSCVPPKLADELTALATPADLAPLLDVKLGLASCALGIEGLPTAEHIAGEVLASVGLNQTIVGNVPELNAVLGELQGVLAPLPESVRDQVNSALERIQTQLAGAPLLEIRVAPTRGLVTSTNPGITSASPGTAVTIDVLGGIIQIELAVARTTASIADGKPAASADVAFARVKALNILSSDPNEALIDQRISAPQDLTLLAGTPLQTSIATERGQTSTSCEGVLDGYDACASGVADAVALSLLADPLPNIGVELVHTEVLAAAKSTAVKTNNPGPVLPKTGAGAAGVVFAGLALAFGGFAVRRRLHS